MDGKRSFSVVFFCFACTIHLWFVRAQFVVTHSLFLPSSIHLAFFFP